MKRGTVGKFAWPTAGRVGFHDRTADESPYPCRWICGVKKALKQPIRILGGDPDAAIRDTDQH